MKTIKTPKDHVILVPVDYSDISKNAFDHAARMADLFDNEIILLHVIESGLFGFLDSEEKKQLITEGASNKLNQLIDEIKQQFPNLSVKGMIKQGRSIYRTIVGTAEELECDIIVMGTNGASGLEQFAGSNASRVIKGSPVPVVVVKDAVKSKNYDIIVLPIDLTKESKQKVSWAIHLAKHYKATIHVISEIETDEFLSNTLKANLHQVEKILDKNEVEYVTKILDDRRYPGNFGKDVIQYSEEVDADLILIMTQQERQIREFFMGSFATQIVNSSQKTPIMCVNPLETGIKFYGTEGFY